MTNYDSKQFRGYHIISDKLAEKNFGLSVNSQMLYADYKKAKTISYATRMPPSLGSEEIQSGR